MPFEHKNHKPLFGKFDIEAGLCSILPLLYNVKGAAINEVVLNIVTTNFYKLKTSVQVYLIVLAEQIGLDLPVHKLIVTLEKLDLCKILRILAKLANVEVLFSQYDPIFTQDSFLSLLPLPFNTNFSVRTTRIFKKTKTSNTKDLAKLESLISNFLSIFFSIFKSSVGFSLNFCRSLTRFLIIFGYSLHISKNERLYNLFLGLLEKFASFYDLHDITLSATALRSFVLLSAIYEYKADWVHTVKAKLLLNETDPFCILSHYLKKVKEEDQAALIIKSCLLYSLKIGYNKTQFLEKCSNCEHKPLIEYIYLQIFP